MTNVLEPKESSIYGRILPHNNTIRKIYLEITEKCNLNCPACFRNNWTHLPTHMSEDVFSKALTEIKQVETVVIGGIGEPTCHPGFAEYTRQLKDKTLELTSNAYYWDDITLDAISSYYKKVTVSVDGLAETFANVRGFDFEIMAENVRRLVEKKKKARSKTPAIHAQFVLSTDNKDEVKSLIPVLKQIGFQLLVISHLLPQTEQDKDRIVCTPYLDRELRHFIYSWYPIAASRQMPIRIPQTKLDSEHRCTFIENGVVCITANGDISPCYRFMHEGQEYVFGRKKKIVPVFFGNIKESSLSDIWYHKEYETFRFQNFASRYPSCVDCDFVELCEYITSSEADCRANEPSCADCLWCRGLIECP